MGKPAKPMGSADRRPRVYVRSTADNSVAAWRIGPSGIERRCPSVGAGVDAALAELGHAPAVIFWEGKTI